MRNTIKEHFKGVPKEFQEPLNGPYTELMCPRCTEDLTISAPWKHPMVKENSSNYYCMASTYKQCYIPVKGQDMSPGKLGAQIAHAATTLWNTTRKTKAVMNDWYEAGQLTLTFQPLPLEDLQAIEKKANQLGIPCILWWDRGHTELDDGYTVLGLGPAPSELMNELTGEMELYTPRKWFQFWKN